MSIYHITADCDWISGHLRYGHYEGNLTEEQYQEYLKAKENNEEEDYIMDVCDLVVDDYRINDHEKPTNIKVKKV